MIFMRCSICIFLQLNAQPSFVPSPTSSPLPFPSSPPPAASPSSPLPTLVYPIINNVSSLTEVNVSCPATLVCLTTGFPLPSITWQKEGEEVMLTMDGRISTFSFDTGSISSSFESSGFMSSGSIKGLIESMTEFNTRDLRSLGELGVVSVLSFDQLEREDTANYTCTATNMLPRTTTLTALSPSIPLVVLGKLVEHYKFSKSLYSSKNRCCDTFRYSFRYILVFYMFMRFQWHQALM